MEQRLLETVHQYIETANMLENLEVTESFDDSVPHQVQEALLKLYYASALEGKLEKCQELLTEETDQKTVDAIEEAAQAIDKAANDAFEIVDQYAEDEHAFAKMIESISLSSKDDSLSGQLFKLYKCEGIIRMVYRAAARVPILGIPGSRIDGQIDVLRIDDVLVTTPEEYIVQNLDIDIYGLLEARRQLADRIKEILGGEEA